MTAAAQNAASEVLVLEYRLPLGCLVHMTPVFEAIKRSRPETRIAVATFGLGLQTLRHSPFVDHLIETPDPTAHLGAAILSLRRQLRRRGLRPDCVLTGASDQRTTIALLGMFGSSGWRGGYTIHPQLYRHPLQYDPALSLIGNNLRLAKLAGAAGDPTEPRVFFSSADASMAAALLEEANPQGKPVAVFVTQNSGGQNTLWHDQRFAEVIRHVALERDFAVIYVGVAGDAAAIEAIRTAAGGIGHSVAGRTSVTELAALLAQSDVAVTLDTGTMHVGRSVQLPMVILGPSWQKPLEWMPLQSANVRILRGPDRDSAPPGYRLDEIDPASVIRAFDELTRQFPPSAEALKSRVERVVSPVDHFAQA